MTILSLILSNPYKSESPEDNPVNSNTTSEASLSSRQRSKATLGAALIPPPPLSLNSTK